METNATALQSQATPAARSAQKNASDGFDVNGDFETFLNLLTTQLRNQDPLNPADSTEFVAQLAQFSSVEQQVKTNQSLDAILSALGGQGAGALAPWIGAQVNAAAALRFDGAPVELTVARDPAATAATLVVKSESGLVVARQPIDPQATTLTWDGAVAGGEPAPAGVYRFSLERMNGSASLPDAEPRGFAGVTEARLADGGVELVLDSGDVISADDVTAIRAAGAAAG